jgi:hypothetical protein
MAQWYAHLMFRGDQLLGEGTSEPAKIEGVREAGGGDPYTAVVISGFALYGKLRGFYSVGVSFIRVDSQSGVASYVSEESALGKESVASLSPKQRAAIAEWLIRFDPEAWESSTEPFKLSLTQPELQPEPAG